ncbi:helix-turn-helix transcriptional regulator [Salmonella enterica]|nr:helix-turn-helix transcriptional regulator [Salmonella enterica]VEA96157.1 putative bacterial regulatory protein, luxR family [Salmonella enterica subsp. houtenae]
MINANELTRYINTSTRAGRVACLPFPLTVGLTRTELSVITALLNGLDAEAISRLLRRSVKTIYSHKRECMRKLGLESNAMIYALGALLGPTSLYENQRINRKLSLRETDVFRLLLQGGTVSSMSRELGVNMKTISTYKRTLMYKLNIINQVELFALEPHSAFMLLSQWESIAVLEKYARFNLLRDSLFMLLHRKNGEQKF